MIERSRNLAGSITLFWKRVRNFALAPSPNCWPFAGPQLSVVLATACPCFAPMLSAEKEGTNLSLMVSWSHSMTNPCRPSIGGSIGGFEWSSFDPLIAQACACDDIGVSKKSRASFKGVFLSEFTGGQDAFCFFQSSEQAAGEITSLHEQANLPKIRLMFHISGE